MPDDDDYSHLGKSLFRSRHYRVTVLRYLDEVSRGSSDRNESPSSSPDRPIPSAEVVKHFPFYSFREPRALFRPQSTRDIDDSKALPQTTFSSSRRRRSRPIPTIVSSSSSFYSHPLYPPRLFLSPRSQMFFLKYYWISRGKDGNTIQNKLDCLSSIVHSPRLT